MKTKILVTGAVGQIGSELTMALRKEYGGENIIAAGHHKKPSEELLNSGPFEFIEVTNYDEVEAAIKKYDIKTIFHLAAILSAVGESKPQLAWAINVNGLAVILEIARNYNCSVFTPSSIGAFGPSTPKDATPQDTIQRPTSMYGVTKVSGELLCDYYNLKFGVDTRGVRYPGLISYVAPPGGGTTDYAVDIYYKALQDKKYECFLRKDTRLDMMYMPDGLKAAIDIMDADPAKLIHRNAFNVTAMNFTPEELAREIKKFIPEFEITYKVDPVRQAIADSWPNSMDDSAATEEWGWKPDYGVEKMTEDMLKNLSKKLNIDI
ncbi:MAG: L-threonine 3-dehydrogenase [Candidatus Aenigmarchaeota archaeon]|nr:L-threonine 3-dehydrogenase [Candidatus Aenigmarchaeota archaeon]